MPPWSFAVPDWESRIRQGKPLLPDLPLFPDQVEQARGVFNRLRLGDVPGKPTMEQACGEWFRDFALAVLASVDPATGRRMVPEAFLVVPKKNSKTTGGALLMLTALLANRRPNAEFQLIAPTQLIAELAFSQVLGAISADAYLAKMLHVQTHKKQITDPRTLAYLRIKSFDPKILTGTRSAGTLLDEVHLLGNEHEADRVVRQLRGGMISQPEAFFVMITTQSERPPAGVFKSELARARDVRDGKRDEAMLAVLYEFPDAIRAARKDRDGVYAWEDPKLWPMVTPNLNRSISIGALISLYKKAKGDGESELIGWASQHLNIEVGQQLRADRWAGADLWQGAIDKKLASLDDLLERCEVVTVGMDGGGLNDLLSLAVIGRERGDGDVFRRRWLCWTHSWAYTSVLEQNKQEEPKLRDFEKAGELTIFDQMGDDIDELTQIVVKIHETGLLSQVGADAAGVGSFVDSIYAAIFGGDQPPEDEDALVVAVPQGYPLQQASKTCERRLADRRLLHGGQGIMTWAVGNAKTEMRGNAMYITKAVSGSAKIDPLMALFDAAFLMARNPQTRDLSIYTADRGLAVFG
jgi:phage terminase large subunit-like protein